MKTPSIAEQRALFETHGWLVLRRAVSAEALIRVTEAFDRVSSADVRSAHPPFDDRGKSLWQIPGKGRDNEVLLAHLHDGLGELAGDLLQAGRTQLLQDTLIIKPARVGAAIEMHQDYTYIGFLDPPKAVSVRLSLTPSTIETGCLYVIDGSHRWGLHGELSVFSHRLQPDVAERLPANLRARVVEDRIPIELSPGDASIHHCLTYHGSFENASGTTQKTVVTHIFDGACRLAPDRLPDNAIGFFDTDGDGHLSRASFPVLFERSRERSSLCRTR